MSVHQISDYRAKKLDPTGEFKKAQFEHDMDFERSMKPLERLNVLGERLKRLLEEK